MAWPGLKMGLTVLPVCFSLTKLWHSLRALEQPMKEQSAMANVENMLNGMMKGVSLVPKEFQSELQAQIGLALRHSDLEVRTGSQLVGLA